MENNFENDDFNLALSKLDEREIINKCEKNLNLVLNRLDECETINKSIVEQVNKAMEMTNDEKLETLLFDISCRLQTMNEINKILLEKVNQ